MPIDVGGLIINTTRQLPPDGSSSSNPARSGLDIKRNYPTKTSGYYWIQSEKMPNPLQMYVNLDSDCDGGGWDFYPITSGISVNKANLDHSGTPLGLDLVYPRSQGHWKAMYRYINNELSGAHSTYLKVTGKIFASEKSAGVPTGSYPTAPNMNGNYTTYKMRNPDFYGDGAPDFRVDDGGRWWLRDTTFGEPNGDLHPYAFLGLYDVGYSLNSDGTLTGFNDGRDLYYTGTSYLVSTNLKG
jgi:hypothetical protein